MITEMSRSLMSMFVRKDLRPSYLRAFAEVDAENQAFENE
jgi:hypothetical protein